MNPNKLTTKEKEITINILRSLADGNEEYWGYSDMDKERKELNKIADKLENLL